MGVGAHARALTQMNRCRPLRQLGRFGEAKAALEACLDTFRHAGDVLNEARVLSSLGHVWQELGDDSQAIVLERQALAVFERLPNPNDRLMSHESLAIDLHRAGHVEEARDHEVASIAYTLVIDLDTSTSLHNLAVDMRDAASRGETFALPRLADLLAKPAFTALRTWLIERGVATEDLQLRIDEVVEHVRNQPACPP